MSAEADLPIRSAPRSRETVALAAAPPLIEGESSAAELAIVAPSTPAREEAA